MGLITYGIRLSLMAGMPGLAVGERARKALGFVPPAVLSAIIFPELLAPSGALDISFTNFRLIAGIIALVVAWRTGSSLLTVASGMATVWILSAL